MRRLHLCMLLCAVLPLTAFIYAPKMGLAPGERIPALRLRTDNNDVTKLASNNNSGFVIVNFWASYDATSRMNNVKLYNSYKKLSGEPVKFVSISLDTHPTIFEESIRLDGIDASTQFLLGEDIQGDAFKHFNLENGFTCYLIDSNGMVVSAGFDSTELSNLLSCHAN